MVDNLIVYQKRTILTSHTRWNTTYFVDIYTYISNY